MEPAGSFPIQCLDCSTHYQLSPGDMTGALACPECGGKRLYRTQPVPTESEGTLRNMVDSDSQKDQGGNPLGEGMIVGDGSGMGSEKPLGKRDNSFVGKVAADEGYNGWTNWETWNAKLMADNEYEHYKRLQQMVESGQATPEALRNYYMQHIIDPYNKGQQADADEWNAIPREERKDPHYEELLRNSPQAADLVNQMGFGPDVEDTQPNLMNPDLVNWDEIHHNYLSDYPEDDPIRQKYAPPALSPEQFQHPDPMMDNEPGSLTFPKQWLWGTSSTAPSVTQKVEMRPATLNMEPYAHLWSDEMVKTAGPVGALLGAGMDAIGAMPTLMKGALMGASAERDLNPGGSAPASAAAAPSAPTPQQPLTAFAAILPMMLVADLETPSSVKSVDEQHDDPEKQDQHEFNDGDNDPKNLKNPNLDDSGANGEDNVRTDSGAGGFGQNSPGIERAMMVMPLLLHYFQSEESGENDPIIRGLHEMLEAENPGYLKTPDHPDAQQFIDGLIGKHQPHGVHAGVGSMPGGLPAVPTPNSPIMAPSSAGNGACPHCGAPLAADGSCPSCGQKGGQEGFGFQNPAGNGGGGSMPPNAYTYQAGVNPFGTTPGGVNPMGTQNQGPQTGGACPSCGGPLGPNGTCPTCQGAQPPGRALDPSMDIGMGMGLGNASGTGVASLPPNAMAAHVRVAGPGMPPGGMPPGGGMMMPPPPPPPSTPNSQMTPELKAALIQLLISQHREAELPDVELHPENFRKEVAQIQHQDTTLAPLPDPTEATPPSGMQDPQGAMPVMDPTQPGGGGGGQMQPMARRAADNMAPRCPKCQSGTTGIRDGNEGEGEPGARCHSCGYEWHPKDNDRLKQGVRLVAVLNPAAPTGDTHSLDPQGTSLTWHDDGGQPLMKDQVYELRAPGHDVPDIVKVTYAHPDELGLKLVGQHANVSTPGDEGVPDFRLTPQQVESKHYTFTPSSEQGPMDNAPNPPLGGMPGLDQIPQSGQTTDEISQSYPNTVASVQAEWDNNDLCDKCGYTSVDHVMSSATTEMHECFRCGHMWETKDEFEGRQSGVDLSWLMNSESWDEGFDMGRAAAMRSAGGASRNLGDIAAKDDRLQRIHAVLSSNRQERDQFHTSGRHYTPSEMRELVDETGHARNLDRLDLRGTHYEVRYDHSGKANGENVPSSHLFMGLAG